MKKPPTPRPTDAELNILRVLWHRGDSTVREVQEELEKVAPTGYTTVLKLLQIMTDKGLVARDESHRAHVYRSADAQQTIQRGLVADLLDRAFGGSAHQLVQHALASRPASRDELAEIRKLLDAMEVGGAGDTASETSNETSGDDR
ncbi:MAG: BlaI/MecI/CopY family transcriptional regulator [Thermoanaerobaculia bacterium]|nr:BlaI/MecI/CopY family transcriptional regulator [Thermoanaerobaculia bacterium]